MKYISDIHVMHFKLSITKHQTENEQYSTSSIDEIQQKYSILHLSTR